MLGEGVCVLVGWCGCVCWLIEERGDVVIIVLYFLVELFWGPSFKAKWLGAGQLVLMPTRDCFKRGDVGLLDWEVGKMVGIEFGV